MKRGGSNIFRPLGITGKAVKREKAGVSKSMAGQKVIHHIFAGKLQKTEFHNLKLFRDEMAPHIGCLHFYLTVSTSTSRSTDFLVGGVGRVWLCELVLVDKRE